ncbi:photosynthetic complex assembly protein PuhC [Thiorhodococcus fuscus]|uniref:Photosynthetic complex assembly protein PuhC n=1 Tax=Thiorhodococcus fuscus TaxID=527200 RepID=A0ABW4YAF0_9GAMM
MTEEYGERPFPRGVLIAVASLLSFVIIMVGVARLTGAKFDQAPLTPIVQERELHFVDQSDGSTQVVDPSTGEVIQTLEPGGAGFIRGVLRAFGRQRKGYDATIDQAPFRLALRQNGNLTLEDPTTGIVIDLRAYGETNQASFAALLPARGASQ